MNGTARHQQIRTQLFHEVELVLGAVKRSLPGAPLQPFEVTKGLESDQFKPPGANQLACLAGCAGERGEVVFKQLKAFEASVGNGVYFLFQRAA